MTRDDFYVGQTVYIHDYENRMDETNLAPATVTRVGKKWVHLDESWYRRFSIDSGMVDGGAYTPTKRLYLSADDFYDEEDRRRAAIALSSHTRYLLSNPVRYPIETLEAILKLLGLSYEKCRREESVNSSDVQNKKGDAR